MQELKITSSTREQFIDITREIQNTVENQGWRDGALLLFCPHTTAALTINENADPCVLTDLTAYLRRLIPENPAEVRFRHAEGNSDAHLKSSLIGPALLLVLEAGRVRLGTWQGVYFFEGDGPRTRTVWLQFLRS